jgi:Domain of unknown function (DUF4209)
MNKLLPVPAAIEDVIYKFEQTEAAFNKHEIKGELLKARAALVDSAEQSCIGAWAELLEFALEGTTGSGSPWKTYFGPSSSGVKRDGTPFYSPDIADTDGTVVEHWAARAEQLRHPVLKSRYADLAWDMSKAIAKKNPDPSMARAAIDAYLQSVAKHKLPSLLEEFFAVIRALNLAVSLSDGPRTSSAKISLLKLHQAAMTEDGGPWYLAIDRLLYDKNTGLIDEEKGQLLSDLESLVVRFSNQQDPPRFNPHAVEAVIQRLIKHYNRVGKREDVKRLNVTLGKTFEYFSSLGNAMIGSSALQVAVNAYREAGESLESQRARVLMEEKIAQSRNDMVPQLLKMSISRDDMETFLASVIAEDIPKTFVQIAASCLDRRSDLEKLVESSVQDAPLAARVSQVILSEKHVAGRIGSVEDDPVGRLIREATIAANASDVWLVHALSRAVETFDLAPWHFASWAARSGLFDDLTLLIEGATAWFSEDYHKAVHILVPQIERGLRRIASQQGVAETKAHPRLSGVSVVINMGDILSKDEIVTALGPDLTLYFLVQYADPRGFNIRNYVAHGLMDASRMGLSLASRLMHTLLVFGIWKELAQARR